MNTFALRSMAALIALSASTFAAAQEDSFPAEERARLRDHAAELKQQARTQQEAARIARDEGYAACWQRTLVSSCIEDTDEAYRRSVGEARKLEIQASEIERDMRTRAAEVRRAEKQRAAEARRDKSIEMSVKTREQEAQRAQDAAARADKDAEMAAQAEARERAQ
ncbi:MAG: hypothetical protein ACOY9I_17155, partial [Pseudomonadota bacterium]